MKRRRGPGKEPGKASLTRAMKAKRKSPLGASKGTPQRKAAKSSQKKQLILTNVLEGLALLDERRGVSMNALKRFLIRKRRAKAFVLLGALAAYSGLDRGNTSSASPGEPQFAGRVGGDAFG